MDYTDNFRPRMDPLEQVAKDGRLRDAIVSGESAMMVRHLIDNGARVNPDKSYSAMAALAMPLLHVAASMNRPTVLEVLAGADRENLDVRDMFGRNALHVAAMEGHGEATHVLMQMGLDPKATDKLGFTPAELAQARGHNNVLNIMRAGGRELELREDIDKLREEVAVAYPQSEHSHVKQVRQRKDGPNFPDIPIR
jgi:hypothetical protein